MEFTKKCLLSKQRNFRVQHLMEENSSLRKGGDKHSKYKKGYASRNR
jgi:hypothetical protein